LDYDDLLPQTSESPEPHGSYHDPVLPEEVLAYLQPEPGLLFLDGTAGGGGHAALLLNAGASVLALDQDEAAIAHCKASLGHFAPRLQLARANFALAGEVLDALGLDKVDGALLDVGVSSHQLETADRGFSFMREGPLDMRMDRGGSMTAEMLVNTSDPAELTLMFREYGEEPRAAQIAGRIAAVRKHRPLRTTTELAACVESVVHRSGPRHPATRIFQALRIAVNDELGCLSRGLEVLSARLRPGGRLAVISFHSLEDRIVKRFFRERSAEWIDRPEWPAPRPNPDRIFRLLTPRPVEATLVESARNPRSRSAKLRVVERL
jgi:16S rRNA (cytosine1402-N4)-methyltransferase